MTKILDCTLRDGSHIRNFTDNCIKDTLAAAENSGIDFFETGYFMPECIKLSNIKLGVMVDAKNICPVDKKADFVRVAFYPEQLKTAIDAVERYKENGFSVFLHIMTADKFEDYEFLTKWENKNILESVYFADSFGSFMPNDVEKIYNNLKKCGFEKVSFHAHNNLQLAFTNTIKAIELGAYSVDGSVFGMGRGAGNLPLELLLKYLNKNNSKYIELIKKYYKDYFEQNRWGYNFENLICGLENIHPSKVKAIV